MRKFFLLPLFLVLFAVAVKAQYSIYPIPQQMENAGGTALLTSQVCILTSGTIDQVTIDRAKGIFSEHNISAELYDESKEGMATLMLKTDESVAVADKYDAHQIVISQQADGNASITVTGQNTDAVFYGLASIEQILEQASGQIATLTISDYADQQQRGLVEGYYGYPYSVAVKKDLMRFMMRLKMNTYLYGAKSDPYHSDYWKDAYPTAITAQQEENGWMTQDMIRDLSKTSAETKVNFIWAIHPGNSFLGSASAVSDIMGKFQLMYSLGVRQFGVFVDDVSIPSSDADMELNASRIAQLQHDIEAKWNVKGATPADTVKPLHFVPQIYCRDFAGSLDQYQRFFRALATTPKNIIVYTTGRGVWSVPNSDDFNMPREYLERNVSWWWNYPCNDNADAQIYPMDMYSNFKHMPAVNNNATLPSVLENGLGIVSNPMQQGEVAKIPLFSVADYAWNNSGFRNTQSWNASFTHILDSVHAKALKTVAPYLTKTDPANVFSITQSRTQILSTIDRQLDAISTIRELETSSIESDRLLWHDLKPWVNKLHDMFLGAKYLMNSKSGTDINQRWIDYATGVALTDSMNLREAYAVYTLEGKGANVPSSRHITMPAQSYLAPYIENLRTNAAQGLLTNDEAVCITNTASSSRVTTGSEIYLSMLNLTLAPGEYAGIALNMPRTMKDVYVTDALCQQLNVLYSADGAEWMCMVPNGAATKPVDGMLKYLVAHNGTDKDVTVSLTKNNFRLVPLAAPTITGVSVPNANDYNARTNFYDGDYTTWYSINRNQKNGDTYVLNLSQSTPINKVRIGIGTTNGDYMQSARVEISNDNAKWTTLSTAKKRTTFGINDMEVYSSECKYIDFFAKGKTAQYIRLYVASPRTGNWLRLYEIEPFYSLSESLADNEAVCDNLPYTYASYGPGQTLSITPREIAPVTGIQLYTDQGIITHTPDVTPENPTVQITFDSDTKVYEIKVLTAGAPDELTGIAPVFPPASYTGSSTSGFDLQGRGALQLPGTGIIIKDGKKVRVR